MISEIKNFFNRNVFNRIISGIFFIIPFLFSIIEGGIIFVSFFISLLAIIIYEFNNSTGNKIKNILKILIIFLFILSFFHFIFLRLIFEDFIINYLLYIIFSIWIFDSFSLIGGKLIGGKKLMPNISPNKTISGLIIGFVSLLIFSLFLIFNYNQNFSILLFTLLIGFISFLGDAIESYYKRFLAIKDFSNFMPGHGGLLDRMDAFILFFLIHLIMLVFIFNPINQYV